MDSSIRGSRKPVAIWIFIGVGMLFIQVMLGGITRLTGSGLSITEWNVVTGALPPMNEKDWVIEFDKYRQTPQYFLLNIDFSLTDFKFIFFWEWLHRFWARLIGVAFLIPFVLFIARRKFKADMIRPLIILFLLGALQGAIGWIMVASGLVGDAVYVKPTRLALHFIFALGLISYAFWFAMQLSVPTVQKIRHRALRNWSVIIVILLFFQLIYGALMAGHKAANAAPSWPSINGSWWPESLLKYSPASINFIENKITIHIVHRGLAYLLLFFTIAWTVKALRLKNTTRYFNNSRWLPLVFIALQVALGIFSVLTSISIIPNQWGIFEWMAESHQVTGMIFLLVMVWMLYLVRLPKHIL
ncbi:MAG: COX15/CtaA family protein [Chitinophagaceae bacterium]